MHSSAAAPQGSEASPDREIWSFSDHGPWVLDPEPTGWRAEAPALREALRKELPDWIRRRAVPPVGRFAQGFFGIGGAAFRWWAGGKGDDLPRRLRRAFEGLGSTYIKLGQILSSGQGLFPPELVEEFKRCRDQVPAEPFSHVREVVEAELGRPLEEVFASFDRDCLASASIAQVHAARLVSGEEVVVKVQRPDVARRVRKDVAALAWIAPWLVGRLPFAALANPPALVELFAETIVEELDFRLEAENMLDVAQVLRDAGQDTIWVPRPHPQLVTRRMLVMERLEGFGYEDVDSMRAAGVAPDAVLRALVTSLVEGAMIYGVFHGDLHGGNLFVRPDGRVALLDFGITGRMDAAQRQAFLRMMMSGAVNDLRGQLAAFRDLGALPPDADLDELARLLRIDQPTLDPTSLSGEQLVSEIQGVVKGLLRHGARLPKHLMLYVKNMIFVDSAVATWAPDLDLFQEFTKVYGYFATVHGDKIARDIGFDPRTMTMDLDGVRRSMGLREDVESVTYSELQERKRTVQEKLEEAGGPAALLGDGAGRSASGAS